MDKSARVYVIIVNRQGNIRYHFRLTDWYFYITSGAGSVIGFTHMFYMQYYIRIINKWNTDNLIWIRHIAKKSQVDVGWNQISSEAKIWLKQKWPDQVSKEWSDIQIIEMVRNKHEEKRSCKF